MSQRTLLLFSLALAALLLGSTAAHATPIQWGYNWNAFPSSVVAGTGWVSLSNEPGHTATGNSSTVATALKVFSTASSTSPNQFGPSQGHYALQITLTDTASGNSGSLLFFGQLQGTFSQSTANISSTFSGPTTQSIGLGANYYTVSLTSYAAPGPPQQGNLGSIGAFVQVQPLRNKLAPEPSSIALASLGIGFAGLGAFRRRRRTKRT
jgi:hypothetical protein